VSLQEYLISKKIDSLAFHKEQPDLYEDWHREFEQQHPNSFTMQKLFLLNKVRRQYPLKEIVQEPLPTVATAKPKPIMRPKMS
jgi:hypothetical protein